MIDLKTIIALLCVVVSYLESSAPNSQEQLSNCQKEKYQLAVCAIFQDETFFLREWIEYHRVVGVEHFYLYNNLSTDNYLDILRPYIDEGVVDLFEWPVKTGNQKEYLDLLQLPAYNDALEKIKGVARWAAFIDLDEFIVPLRHRNLLDMLLEYEDCAGLAINWQIFGTSNIEDLPANQLITENFVLKAPHNHSLNEIVKLIVQPQYVKSIQNPHTFQFFPNYYAVNSNKIPLNEHHMGQPVVLNIACINHYWFGSRRWLLDCKMPRREKWNMKFSQERLEEIISAHNAVRDEAIHKFVPQLKQRMALSAAPIKTPFITCDLMGQLGNQFFQIAAATSLALDCGATPLFPSLVNEKAYNIPLNYSKVFYHLNTNQPESPIEHVYIEPQFPYSPIPVSMNMSIRGWFQSEKYFRHHKHEIMALFAPHPEINNYLQKKYAHILQQDTVSIHYRSYDVEDPQHTVYAQCGMEYFSRAINTFPKDSLFVVFSNDMEWCKENLSKIPRNFFFVEGEAHYHDLYLMSMCKHNIICNSSFSWWAAYLNVNPDKQIIAPKKWFNPIYEAKGNGTKDLIPEEWTLL